MKTSLKYLTILFYKYDSQLPSSGFTLIELLVVILIIGILASISTATMFKIIHQAKETEALANINYCQKQQQTYYVENTKFAESLDSIGLSSETQNYLYDLEIFPPTKPEDGNVTLACCMALEKGGERQMLFLCASSN
ncbi:MAG: type IV pilin-like G/H family protein [Limnoraphis robusta]|uniref:Type IV pilin-like G/H family protein n=1 Tax=Limnoraphis robusta CCNP1315 TaxID=3110306 RepID=A0ABU5TWG6_9CYAN|nr:type IV pilin-like G/H family protein [Limnoraphis robusta]MEA5519130.1 type IV pilin-like G/H family protein [Limnoraphis robusta CCNP1315]MEA5538311.1 type IV pilin-like G/H family protein [Limnoraphis robusta Tam1]MEA5548113.1 type IV pilin-like G/H family protein [Limnoraphis robusta CCNP1324]